MLYDFSLLNLVKLVALFRMALEFFSCDHGIFRTRKSVSTCFWLLTFVQKESPEKITNFYVDLIERHMPTKCHPNPRSLMS